VKRRMELRGTPGGVLVIDDFAHHPTAIREVIAATRLRYPGQRLFVAFEPRSWSCRGRTHQDTFPIAFAAADRVLFAPVHGAAALATEDRLDVAAITEALEQTGVKATATTGVGQIQQLLTREARAGDIILVLSNGSFDGLHEGLLDGLANRSANVTGESSP